MTTRLILAIVLYGVCAALLIAEVFLPSGGILGLCALAAAAGGIALFFQQGVVAGWIGVGTALVMIPSILVLAYRVFPKTRFGRAVTLVPPERPTGDAVPDADQLRRLVGARGVVVTPLRPVGVCEFSGKRIECLAESGYVDRGVSVEVIRVHGTQPTVRIRSS
ncbi:MAG: hypothetical protein KBE04_03950 [Phycisphaerae bacterium]|nr:hypothetical protein [Phycisphaerae bacterium]